MVQLSNCGHENATYKVYSVEAKDNVQVCERCLQDLIRRENRTMSHKIEVLKRTLKNALP